jgi:hypothetical protein
MEDKIRILREADRGKKSVMDIYWFLDVCNG